jgi:transcriptional regulator with XRE-family HTH domain
MSFSGERLRTARKYKNLTIDDLISLINQKYEMKLNNGMVSKWENNKVIPRIDAVSVIAEFLGVPSDYLIGKKDFGNILLDLRLKANLTTDQLVEKSGVSKETVVLTEASLYFPSSEKELMDLGLALGVENLRDYMLEEEYFGPLTIEDYDQWGKPEINPSSSPVNIQEILESKNTVYYKDRPLTRSELDKIRMIVEVILEENNN